MSSKVRVDSLLPFSKTPSHEMICCTIVRCRWGDTMSFTNHLQTSAHEFCSLESWKVELVHTCHSFQDPAETLMLIDRPVTTGYVPRSQPKLMIGDWCEALISHRFHHLQTSSRTWQLKPSTSWFLTTHLLDCRRKFSTPCSFCIKLHRQSSEVIIGNPSCLCSQHLLCKDSSTSYRDQSTVTDEMMSSR